MRHQWKGLCRLLSGFFRQEHGAGTAFYVLGVMGLLACAAFIVDSMQTTGDAVQIKRATDAAALAVGHQVVSGYAPDGHFDAEKMNGLAFEYVRNNLGLNSKLVSALTQDKVRVTSGYNGDNNRTYTVTVTFNTDPDLLKLGRQEQQIYSTVEVRTASLEVALALPSTSAEDSSNLAALRRIGNGFASHLLGDSDNTWLALVPYSQAVNVYDAEHPGRIRQWASKAGLNPVELTTLFQSGYDGLADSRIPDRRYNLLCMYRGLNQGDNYFWDEAPAKQFQVYYRADLPENAAEPYYISWTGPNPSFGQAEGDNATRYMVVDKGCPYVPLLPLNNDPDKISARLNAMRTGGFNVNYSIAIGWAAMALSPTFRGDNGWGGGTSLPKDFDKGNNEHIKAVVLLVNSTNMLWFDVDSYNAYVGKPLGGCPTNGASCNYDSVVTQRFANLCSSFRSRGLRFYLVVTGNDEAENESDGGNIASASKFRKTAGAGLSVCAVKSTDLTYYNGADFVASESKITDRLTEIAEELQQESSFVRLIE